MANTDYGAIPLTLAEGVSEMLNKKLSVSTGFKPSEWADNINLLGKLPVKTASGSIAHFDDGADDVPLKSYKFGITAVQSGTGTPSPSNVRPISGWNKVSGQGTGKNLWGGQLQPGNYSNADFDLTATTTLIQKSLKIWLKKGTYTISFGGEEEIRIIRELIDGGYATTAITDLFRWTFNTTKDGYVGLSFRREDSANWVDIPIQIEVGSTATAYSPYNSTPFEIPLGDTIYGGWVDEQGNGEVTHKYIDLSDFTWYRNAANICYTRETIADIKIPTASSIAFNGLAEQFSVVSYNEVGSNINSIGLRDTAVLYVNNNADTEHNPDGHIIYELATPIPFTLSDMPVINSRLGTNNFWVDSGDSEVQYRADIDLALAQ